MEREIIQKLINWKNSTNRKPLIIRGARQVGKSWAIQHLGSGHYKGKLHVVNFEKNPDWKSVFEPNLDPKRIIEELEIVLNEQIHSQKDLLFFDEIQECPNAIKSLRYFYEEMPDLHVISAGSLLEFALRDIPFPVGRVQMMNMHPMNFTEYIMATQNLGLLKVLKGPITKQSDLINKTIKEQLRKYFFIGGMPESVQTYIKTNSLKEVQIVQNSIIETYKQDFSKYNPVVNRDCLNDVLDSVSNRIGQQIKYTKLSSSFSGPTNKKAFDVLRTARIFHRIRNTSPSGLPLSAHVNSKQFKALFLDIGLLVRLSGLSIAQEYHKDQLLNIFSGALAEQFVGQEFRASGMDELYYWSRTAKNSNAEVDYLIASQGNIIPIEVKNSAAGRLRSLHLLLKTYPNCPRGIVLSDSKFGSIPEQKLEFLPIYWAGRLANQD